MTDMTSAEMSRFYGRYDNRNRLLFVAALSASVVLSAVNLTHGLEVVAPHGAKAIKTMWAFGIVFPPLFTLAWWIAMEGIARWRDGLPAASRDSGPNGVRIANAGFFYNIALIAAVLGAQTLVTLSTFGYAAGDWFPRAMGLGIGAALICLGNVWPRLRTRPVSDPKAAQAMKINRIWGWIMVLMGAASILSGLFLPLLYPFLTGLRP
jgi:hypothetical protein